MTGRRALSLVWLVRYQRHATRQPKYGAVPGMWGKFFSGCAGIVGLRLFEPCNQLGTQNSPGATDFAPWQFSLTQQLPYGYLWKLQELSNLLNCHHVMFIHHLNRPEL